MPQASSLVDISPLGQMLSGLALSRRQLLALQGGNPDPAATTANPQDDAASLTALAQQLADSLIQLRSNGIGTTRLPLPAKQDDTLASEFAQLSQPQETAPDSGPALNQTALAGIGIDLQAEPAVNPPLLQAAFETDRDGTLSVLLQTTDLLTRVAAALTPAVELNADQASEGAAAIDATPDQPATPERADVANSPAAPQSDAQIQRQQEVQRQIDTQALTQATPEEQVQLAQQERLDTLAEMPRQQRQSDVQTGLQQQADAAAAEAVAARAAATAAQQAAQAAQAATARAQGLADEVQASQNPAPETVEPQPLSANPPSSQDPAIAAAIAAYHLNNAALNPALTGRQPAGAHPQKPAVTPVEAVTPVKPVTPIAER
ncbi:hypothetical protein [Janthinobacterium agaricidamnosum]|uniref:Uncharacterized protein n=1 Tax=Janthinobacterium agaricidamnosum NBRC 102515 = DSM 9628 TaxID=1349767 RepID=W0V964_9BURK|nr:hypothetical protein [Janthinobacterium agaricidamnosum]CDG84416.1 hypothetical protein GJA_3802 [Janthinobacterium agaricidamnosum NBRC 102515 = DSM 9628]